MECGSAMRSRVRHDLDHDWAERRKNDYGPEARTKLVVVERRLEPGWNWKWTEREEMDRKLG